MSPELREHLTRWLAWATSENPNDDFRKDWGLCDNETTEELQDELQRIFKSTGLDSAYPFGRDAYYTRYRNYTQHKCPARLAWVREQLGFKSSLAQRLQTSKDIPSLLLKLFQLYQLQRDPCNIGNVFEKYKTLINVGPQGWLSAVMLILPKGYIISTCLSFSNDGQYRASAQIINSFSVGRGQPPQDEQSYKTQISSSDKKEAVAVALASCIAKELQARETSLEKAEAQYCYKIPQ